MTHYGVGSPNTRRHLKPSWKDLTSPEADHIIQVDGSMKGLCAVLLHKGKLVIYMSRSLTPVETG